MTVPGAEFGEVGPQRLDRIEDDEVRPPAFGDRREDVLDIGFGGEFDRRAGGAEPLRAQPHLRDGLLAGDVDDAMALVGERCRGLHQQRRLADAGIAADQHAPSRARSRRRWRGRVRRCRWRCAARPRSRPTAWSARPARPLRGERRPAARRRCRPPCLPRRACSTRRRRRICPPSAEVTLPQAWQMNWMRGLAIVQRSGPRASRRCYVPPSGLPAISPTRGEISWLLDLRQSPTLQEGR